MPTPTVLAIRQAEQEYIEQLFAAYRARVCPQCGGLDGMEALEPGSPALDQPATDAGFYQWPDHHNDLYWPCWQCNPGGKIPAGYIPITATEAVEWDQQHGGPKWRQWSARQRKTAMGTSCVYSL